MKRHYLDHNATTPLLPEAARAMRPYFTGQFGNPSSIHAWGRAARAALDKARSELALLLGAQSREITFCSGGTEANNLALFGVARALKSRGKHIVTCATEHHSVLYPFQQLEREGFEATILPVDNFGRFHPDLLEQTLRPDTILVSVMSANNETGTRHPIREIGAICRSRSILFHCDAIQSFGKEKVEVSEWKADLLTIAAHKFYGPKGAALLYARSGISIQSLNLGGAQENDRRAGTENVAAIVGMAAAARWTAERTEAENERLFRLTEELWKSLSGDIPEIQRNGHSKDRLGNTLNVSFAGCDGENLLMGLDLENLAVSSGSACIVGSVQPSHVLRAMGLPGKWTRAAVRFSLGHGSTARAIPQIVARVARVVKRVRS